MAHTQPTLPAEAAAKVGRYNWNPLGDSVPIRSVPVGKIHVDMTYQRDHLSESKILGIAGSWNHAAAGVLTVSQRNDGTFWVIDGNHRREAALRRGDIASLPCRVVVGLDLAGEAALFRALNMYRTNVNAYTKYKSALVSGDLIVAACQAMLERHGLHIAAEGECPSVIAFPQAIVQRFAADAEVCELALGMVRAMIGDRDQIGKDLHAGAFYILRRCDRRRAMQLAAKVPAMGGKQALMQACKAKSCELSMVRSHERVSALGILELLNYRTKSPLTLGE